MQMSECPFCGERSRLGVVVKQLRKGDGLASVGAYCRCKKCHARGPIVSDGETNYARDLRLPADLRQHLVDAAVSAWNRVRPPVSDLPLFSSPSGAEPPAAKEHCRGL